MTNEENSVSPDVITALRVILSYSCGFYDLKSEDRDPFQCVNQVQGTDQ